jgi:hypothetical protein
VDSLDYDDDVDDCVDADDYDVGDYVGVDDDADGYDCGGDAMKSLDLENLYVNQLCGLLLYLRKHLQSFK